MVWSMDEEILRKQRDVNRRASKLDFCCLFLFFFLNNIMLDYFFFILIEGIIKIMLVI